MVLFVSATALIINLHNWSQFSFHINSFFAWANTFWNIDCRVQDTFLNSKRWCIFSHLCIY